MPCRPIAPSRKRSRPSEHLADNVPLDEIIYRLHVLSKIHQGLGDLDNGRVVPSEELAAEIEQW